MNRWRGVVAAVLTLALLGGCETPDATPDGVVLLVAGRQLDFVQEIEIGFGRGVERIGGVQSVEVGPDVPDSAQELKAFQEYRDGRRGPISLFTLAPELFADSLGQAATAGTPLIALHSMPAPGSGVKLFIGNDNTLLGTMLGRAVAERLPAGAEGLVVLGAPTPGVLILNNRVEAARAELQRLRPGLTVIGPFDTKQDPVANLQAWRTLQAANPDALAFVGVGGADAHNLAVLHPVGSSRVDGGFGSDWVALSAAAAGTLVLVSTEPYLQGWLAGALQARSLRTGRPLPEGWLVVPGILVDSGNAAEIIARQRSTTTRAAWFADQATALLDDPDRYLRPLDEAA
ncbi:MAG: sugar ABC transporter substrate-binding protein [Actinoplanes sp.]